jgi:hypothetical protein
MRRLSTYALIWGAIGLLSAGCETHKPWIRRQEDEATTSKKDFDVDTTKIPSVDSDSKDSRPFFKSNRLQGGWSSEARAVERDLGVTN